MFSRNDRGDDLFKSSTIDSSSNPNKIIIREKDSTKKKVRRRVKKGTKEQVLLNKEEKKGKVKVTSTKKKDDYDLDFLRLDDKRSISGTDKKSNKKDDNFKIPRLAEIEKKKAKDDYDQDLSSDFRASSADWRDRKYPDYSGLSDLSSDSFIDKLLDGIKSASVMQWIALALAVVIFISSIMTTNVYAKRECLENKQSAMQNLAKYEDTTFEQVAMAVEDVEAPISMEEAKPQLGKAVTLVLSSVEKDLKIKLVDEDDTLVRDVSWSVTIDDSEGNSSEQNDDDKDGIIHMTDMSAGDYSVTLNPSDDLADYSIPQSSQVVSVKAKVEYKVIQDIKEEIKSEKEINAAVEDAAGNQAADVETSSPMQDTVEFVESTKTANGEGYVEATPDLTKTASNKNDNIFLAAINKLIDIAKSGFGQGISMAYPILLDPVDGAGGGAEETPEAPAHTHDKYTSNGNGTHSSTCAVEGCSATVTNESCDTSGADGTCSKCGYKAPAPEHTHNIVYTSNGSGKHSSKCTAGGCTGYTGVIDEACDTSGEGGKCSKCGYKAQEASISLNQTSASIAVGATLQLTATVSPSATVTYSSSDASVATVDSTGKVKALKAGSTTIKAGANGKEATCTVTVTAATEASLTLSGTTSVNVGETTTVTAALTPADAKITEAKTADSSIATATFSGNVVTIKGVKAGSTKLTVKGSNGKENSVTITVSLGAGQYSDDAQLYDASKNALYVKEGDTYRLAKYRDYKNNPSQKFYRKESTYKYTGWQTIEGKRYYYDKNNVAVTGEQIIGGVKYTFGSDGALVQGNGTLGIDVSKYQPSINWASVKASGIDYVIIRCGYRGSSTGVLVEDPYFKSHIKGAKAAGLKVGIYFFTTAISEAEAVEEASMVAYLCKGYGVDYPVFMDCESSSRPGYNGMSASQRTAIIKAFCNTIRSAGYTPGVYANKTWLTSYMHAGELSGYKIWLAQYNSGGPTYSGRYDMWQYTSKGSVNGISGYVDMNQSYLGY